MKNIFDTLVVLHFTFIKIAIPLKVDKLKTKKKKKHFL